MIPDVGGTVYREEARVNYYGNADIVLREWTVQRKTPCGAWLVDRYGCRKWVGQKTRFAWPTKEEARQSLVIRSRHRYQHANRRRDEAMAVLRKLGAEIPRPDFLIGELER